MSVYDSIAEDAKRDVLQVKTVIDPSLNGTVKPAENESKTDPSAEVLNDIDDASYLITDNRTSQNTGKLIHNWWVFYLKSLKKFMVESFDDSINNFEFNYANKSVLLKKLYNQPDVEHPSCIMNLNNFRTDSNLDPKRRNVNFYNLAQTTVLAKNKTKSKDVRVDFKFVNISQTITINFDDATDVLNYYDRFTTVFPLNKNFINYEYKTLINIHNETSDWEITDDMDGIIYDAAILGSDNNAGPNSNPEFQTPQRWGQYTCCPQFTLTSINQNIDKQGQKYSLQIELDTLLRVPQTIITRLATDLRIRAIQVILDIGTEKPIQKSDTKNLDGTDLVNETVSSFTSLDKPICIDIDRNIYEDYKMENSLFISPKVNFNMVDGVLLLPRFLRDLINKKAAALYLIQDSTVNEPELFWTELGYIFSNETEQELLDSEELSNVFTEEVRSITYLKDKGIDLGIEWDAENTLGLEEPTIETLEIKINNFDNIKEALKNAGAWFDARLFLFNMQDPGLLD